VIKEAKLYAQARLTLTDITVVPTITAQAKAQEEADCLNIINQAVICAKEGAVNAITKFVGRNITDAILHTPSGSNHKGVDDFRLFDVMQAAIDGANHQSTNSMLEQLLEVINHTFDFRKKISVNMELLQSNVAQMATYGIVIGIPQLVLTLLANIETMTKADYGHKFCLAMHFICKKYTYNHVHNAMSLQIILTELASANGVRVLKDAPTPSAGMAHSVANSVPFLHSMMDSDDSNLEYTKLAYSTTSNSKLLEEECKPRRRDCKKDKQAKARGKKEKKTKKDYNETPAKNTCPHCKKIQCRKPHWVNPDKCMWNKKYK
jgi:hypothetical protein